MPTMTRRRFLAASAGAGALGLAGAAVVDFSGLLRAATERPLASGDRVLVLVTLEGGNDGINTLIPYADSAYHDARPELAYKPSEVLPLDGQLGLNPGLTGLAGLWKQQRLAIVRGVGYPQPDHSHFRSMDIWQTASPQEPVPTGWIGRYLDSAQDPLQAINIGAVLPPLAVGANTTAATLVPGSAAAHDAASVTMAALGVADPHDTPAMTMVTASYRSAVSADKTLHSVATKGNGHDGGGLDEQLQTVARCIAARVPTRVYTVALGGFDTHADERGTQQRLLGTFDTAVTNFFKSISTLPHGDDVVLMAYSEFGRRVRANASQGTDHGTAAPVFIAGAPVSAGFHGDEPSLTDLDNGDLKMSTDFRDIYYDLLAHCLGTDPEPVVGSGRRGVGVLTV